MLLAKKKFIVIALILVLVLLAIWFLSKNPAAAGELDGFAQCLSDKGFVMYGAEWCPHCQKEKRAFGDSFRLVNYVECPENIDRCLAIGIDGYPTWIGPDGVKYLGEQGLPKLSTLSGCSLPEPN